MHLVVEVKVETKNNGLSFHYFESERAVFLGADADCQRPIVVSAKDKISPEPISTPPTQSNLFPQKVKPSRQIPFFHGILSAVAPFPCRSFQSPIYLVTSQTHGSPSATLCIPPKAAPK